MQPRWLAALCLGLVLGTPIFAQQPIELAQAPAATEFSQERPTELPPLLTPPPPSPNTANPAPGRAPCEYDPGYLYLPDQAPSDQRLPPCPCRPLGQWWFTPTLELGWSQPAHVPGLVRSGVSDGNGGVVPGQTLYGGNQAVSFPFRAGLGLSTGVWLDRCQNNGIDASFFYFAPGSNGDTIFSSGTLLLPYVNGATGQQQYYHLADPTIGVGAFQAFYDTHYFTGDVNYRRNLYCEDDGRIDFLVGYRYADLNESLDIYGKRAAPGDGIIRFRDTATAANHFNGGQIGLSSEYRWNQWFVSVTKKIAFGDVSTDTNLDGAFRTNSVVVPYGFYSRPLVNGFRSEEHFGILGLLNLTAGRQIGEHCRVFAGYNLQYLDGVVRASNVIDPNPDAFGPGTGTKRDSGTTSFWIQTITMGVDVRF